MDNELYSLALKTTLDEIQKLCPEIKNAFIFREDREVIAADESTSEKTVQRMTEAIDGMLQKNSSHRRD